MRVISVSPDSVTTTPNATMTGLAAPSRGSSELSTWTVDMPAEATGPEHSVSREQVWTVTTGTLEVTCDGRTERVTTGQTLVLPPDVPRTISAPRTLRGPRRDARGRRRHGHGRGGHPRTALGALGAPGAQEAP
ncbi:hypothetical protein GCM10020254_38440 [Streptomyces goshikiensis]